MKHLTVLLALAGLFASCGTTPTPPANDATEPSATTINNEEMQDAVQPKELAINAFNALFRDYSEDGVKNVFAEDIIQHNPFVPTGRDVLLQFVPMLKEAGTTYQNHRLFQDGDYAIMNNTLNNAEAFGAKEIVSFNIYRTENGKIVEHWGVPVPIVENPVDGVTQFGGATEVTDLDKTDENKAAVVHLFDVIVNGTPEQVGETVTALFDPEYVNHSPTVANGIPALFEAFSTEEWVYLTNHKILGEGNFVLSISEGTAKGNPVAFYDLLRFKDGIIVEHWDVIFPTPSEGMANENGMFGFQ